MKLAIIGSGYTGTSLFSMLETIFTSNHSCIDIDMYDRANEAGTGLAYQKDISSNILNRPAKAMYMNNKNDFLRWAMSSYPNSLEITPESFLQRSLFGNFLKEKLLENIERYRALGCRITTIALQVEDIRKAESGWCVVTKNNKKVYDAVFLCTGTSVEADPYQLKGTLGYLSNPYPINRLGSLTGRVGILGSRLTAYDVALGLNYSKVTHAKMLSRVSDRPRPVTRYHDIELKYLSPESTEAFINSRDTITLESVLNLINRELRHQGIELTIFQLASAKHLVDGDLVTSVLTAANYSLSLLWQNLSRSSRNRLMGTFQSRWANMRVPVSLQNHAAIEVLIERGKVSHSKGITNVSCHNGQYCVETDKEKYFFDFIINATGIRRSLDRSNPVLDSLLSRKLAKENQYGGINVCPSTCSVLSETGEIQMGLYALGQITCGDFYMVNNIDVINNQISTLLSSFKLNKGETKTCI
ncbi:FAD-dependent urate hydroxylase HpyO FAD/NAD(P)-binding domain-containing protein [Vibrio crassostreae]|nr:FAD-dependent urate hydroxylase HpyO FAD/NAD(P)-binding domain-containing protein [Vibrio crassostreae]CAK2020091.1 FAD-dependent urate hydroxylase HpyO FAD/NAD(P)-binding domain-containing protein [Vibrio crassostreae]CAK2822937.1 FAD-dependent urate hydroxylase HpyO FAD/NAD(P)-binding domain-containing protein [Vibrio crassostreae]CAK3329688.1 FAD-dependent urate hydroxylase HpyO FAD/NAD(P)-binding domain-containing protein [Vibrio crassostreae]CAK3919675.1 FAD-dependent urate hydroxylase 